MALSKKYVVQKSFRIDAKLERDLEQLSIKLGRPQNDLVNFSLELLMKDNRMWFAENIIVDNFYQFFEGSCEDLEKNIGNVYIRLYVNEKLKNVCEGKIKSDDGKIVDKWKHMYEDSSEALEEMKDYLKQMALIHLFNKTEVIDAYLETRLDYR